MKKGVIDKKEFKRRAAIGAVAKLGGLAGTSIGAMTGFIIGSAIMPGVGTAEPGGLFWDETMQFLRKLTERKNVVGFDIVECAPKEGEILTHVGGI